ncbi:MAG TPA: C2H2-type zinc finger protein [Streptosporangiaceae bacterium]|jgi:hypothetical protein|nr:C2H2-type zinc finger protein [Actinomycetota bacterium]
MTIVQCPKCQLRFPTPSELLSHLRMDHRRTTGLGLPDRLHRSARRRVPVTTGGERRV